MSLKVQILLPDAKKIISDLEKMPMDIRDSQKSALGSVGLFVARKAKRWMKSEGEGSWAKIHPLTAEYRKAGLRGSTGPARLIPRSTNKPFLARAGQFARYINSFDFVSVGFAFDQKPSRFNSKLEELIATQERGYRIYLTPKMQRFLAIHGHPIKKSTRSLYVPPRPITGPVSRQVANDIPIIFSGKFSASLGRKNDFADGEFRRGSGIEKVENEF